MARDNQQLGRYIIGSGGGYPTGRLNQNRFNFGGGGVSYPGGTPGFNFGRGSGVFRQRSGAAQRLSWGDVEKFIEEQGGNIVDVIDTVLEIFGVEGGPDVPDYGQRNRYGQYGPVVEPPQQSGVGGMGKILIAGALGIGAAYVYKNHIEDGEGE